MKLRFLVAAAMLAALVYMPYAYAEDAATAPQTPAPTVEGMASSLLRHFPRAEGTVTAVEDTRVTIDLGSADGLRPGMEVRLYRRGRPILHPVTKAVLGSREEFVGRAVTEDVGEHASAAKVAELAVTMVVDGDIARLPTEPAKLLVLAVGADYDELVLDRVMGVIRGSSRFDIRGPAELPRGEALDAPNIKKRLAESGSDNLLVVDAAPSAQKGKTDVSLGLYAADGTAVEALKDTLEVSHELYGEEVMAYPLVRGEYRDFFRTEELPYRGRHMAAGRVMGSGGLEIVVSDGVNLKLYRFEEGALREIWGRTGRTGDENLAIDCADMDGDGYDEIYVTNFRQQEGISSYVVEYDGKGFRDIVSDSPLLFRVLDVPGGKRMLLCTNTGMESPYSGVITEYAWKDGALVKGERLKLPSRITDPYGFALADIVPDDEAGAEEGPLSRYEIVWVDDADYIVVMRMDGRKLWKSPEHYGGYDTFFEQEGVKYTMPNVDPRGKVKGRVVVAQGRDGGVEFILTKNEPMTYVTRRFKGYSNGSVHGFRWDGQVLEELWGIPNIDGYIADMAFGEVVKAGRDDILLLIQPTMKMVKKSKSVPLGGVESLANIIADSSSLKVYREPVR